MINIIEYCENQFFSLTEMITVPDLH